MVEKLPKEIWSHIISFIPVGTEWLNLLLLNRVWYGFMKKLFDPFVLHHLPLRWACLKGHVFFVRELLEDRRLRPEVVFEFVEHPLGIAARSGNLEIVKLLLEKTTIDPTMNENYAIRVAAHFKHPHIVAYLLQHPLVKESLTDGEIEPLFPIPQGNLSEIGWLGLTSRKSTESILQNCPPGSYAIRWSANTHSYVLSYNETTAPSVMHTPLFLTPEGKIQVYKGGVYDNLFLYLQQKRRVGHITHPYCYKIDDRYQRSFILSPTDNTF